MPSIRLPRLDAEHPREARARRSSEAVLAFAAVVSLVVLAFDVRRPAAPGASWRSLAVDVARDGRGRLRLLPGVGTVRASAILDDRARHGPVESVEELDRVRGLGQKTVRALVAAGAIVGPPPPARRPPEEPVAPRRR